MMPRSERLDPDTATRPHNSDAWPDSWSSALVSTGSGHWRFPLAIPTREQTPVRRRRDQDAWRRVVRRVLRRARRRPHEFDRPGGPGICNAIEHAVAIVADAYLRHLNLEVTEVTWILHNDAQTSTEEWTRSPSAVW